MPDLPDAAITAAAEAMANGSRFPVDPAKVHDMACRALEAAAPALRAQGAAAEREACAQLAYAVASRSRGTIAGDAVQDVADLIRAREPA